MDAPLVKPSNVGTSGTLMLVGGILTLLVTLSVGVVLVPSTGCMWTPITVFGLVAGILNIVKGSQLMGECSPGVGVPIASPILLIVNCLNCDMVGPILGIITLVLVNDPATSAYLNGHVVGGAVPAAALPGAVPAAAPVPSPGQGQVPQWAGGAAEAPKAETAAPGPHAEAWGTATPEAEAEAEAAIVEGAWNNWGGTEDPAPDPAQSEAAPTGEEDPLSVEVWDLDISRKDDSE
jgi:hypothetical protein